jgi:hypothetical protein
MALAAAGLAGPVMAQQATPLESDLRCITILSAATGNTPDGEKRLQLAAAVMYFVGRVDGEAPKLDLTGEIRRIVPTLTQDMVATEAARCAGILTTMGTRLQDVGKALQDDGRAK